MLTIGTALLPLVGGILVITWYELVAFANGMLGVALGALGGAVAGALGAGVGCRVGKLWALLGAGQSMPQLHLVSHRVLFKVSISVSSFVLVPRHLSDADSATVSANEQLLGTMLTFEKSSGIVGSGTTFGLSRRHRFRTELMLLWMPATILISSLLCSPQMASFVLV